jgi:DNA-binding NtrC family response regulator
MMSEMPLGDVTFAAAQDAGSVLVVDDEPGVRFALTEVLTEAGFRVLEAPDVARANVLVTDVDAVVCDLQMPGSSGLDLLDRLKREGSHVPVIILTARGSERAAVAAIKRGAWDYLTKPFDNDELTICVRRAVQHHRLLLSHSRRAAQNHLGSWVIGESPSFTQLLSLAQRVARRDVNVLLLGETGTGKEGIANLIHAQSARRSGPLVRFNCGALTESLAAAELFGHERGAFTGATQRREGYFPRAHGGTLLLDEVSELPLSVQATLLRALQQGEIQAVGATQVAKVDVRVIACSAVSLADRVSEGRFRADLYYRIKVVELCVPPLRERASDVALLARHFQLKYAERFGFSDVPLPEPLIAHLTSRAWPGNVRELENQVAQLLALSDDGHVSLSQLPLVNDSELEAAARATPGDESLTLRERVTAFERTLIEAALTRAGHNQSQAARLLGTTRTTLIDKMKRLGIIDFPRP